MVALLWLGACSVSPPPPPPPADAIDVVVVVVDSLRRDRTSTYGHVAPTTPTLDALAAGGVRYERATSVAPWTLPAMAGMLTGQLPSSLGVTQHDSRVPDDALLISEALSAAGWATAAISSHSFFSPDHNLQQGFSVFDTTNIVGHQQETSEGVTDAALRFLTEHPSEPVFLVAHYFDPHFAYIAHRDAQIEMPAHQGQVVPGMSIQALRALQPSDADRDAVMAIYDGEIAHTDAHIGRLMAGIAARGRLDQTLVVVTHDHGEAFWEHGHLGHTIELYEQAIASPLVVDYPAGWGPPAGTAVAERVSLLDLPVTIAAITGVEDVFAGHALFAPQIDRIVQSETLKGADLRAVLTARHKLIWDRKADTVQLFDLAQETGTSLVTEKYH